MSYYINELKNIIETSKISKKEIAKKCYISASAISKVIKEKQEPFSEDINRQICKTCGEDTRILNIALALDLIGSDFYKFIDIFKEIAIQTFKIQYPDKDVEILNNLSNTSLTRFIIYLIECGEMEISKEEKKEVSKIIENFKNINEKTAILNNDKMEPFIPKNAILYLDYESKDSKKNDTVYIRLKNSSIIVGQVAYITKDEIIIYFANIKYKTIKIKREDIKMIVKVKSFKYDFY